MGHFRALPGASRAAGATLNSLGAAHTAVSLYIRAYSSIHAIQPYSARSSSQRALCCIRPYSAYSIHSYSLYTIHPHTLPLWALLPQPARRSAQRAHVGSPNQAHQARLVHRLRPLPPHALGRRSHRLGRSRRPRREKGEGIHVWPRCGSTCPRGGAKSCP